MHRRGRCCCAGTAEYAVAAIRRIAKRVVLSHHRQRNRLGQRQLAALGPRGGEGLGADARAGQRNLAHASARQIQINVLLEV